MQKSNNKGFTLAELLIVVAIIGVLVAISIPIFTSQLRKARLATNQANARAAYAAAISWFIENGNDSIDQVYKDGGCYDVSTGVFTPGVIGGTGKTNSATISDTNISGWTVDSPVKSKASKKCLGDVTYNNWDIYWNQSNFDGTIETYVAWN